MKKLIIIIVIMTIEVTLNYGQSFPYTNLVTDTGDPTIYINEPSVAVYNDNVIVGTNYVNWSGVFLSLLILFAFSQGFRYARFLKSGISH